MTRSSLPYVVAITVTTAFSGYVLRSSEDLSGEGAEKPPLQWTVAVGERPAAPEPPAEPLLVAEPAATPDPVTPAAPVASEPSIVAEVRQPREVPFRRPELGARQAERAVRLALASSRGAGDGIASLDRSTVSLKPADRAAVLARLLDSTPRSGAGDEVVIRTALIDRLGPLSSHAPARTALLALVELSPDRDERISALRALGRGPMPLALEARASVAVAAASSDPLVGVEAQCLLAVSDRFDPAPMEPRE